MMSITAQELWAIFNEECHKLGYIGLRFPESSISPPEDLTLWENVVGRLNEEQSLPIR